MGSCGRDEEHEVSDEGYFTSTACGMADFFLRRAYMTWEKPDLNVEAMIVQR